MEKTLIEKYIEENGEFIATPVGVSMWPMLRHRRDTVYLVKYTGGLKKYDLPIYKRADGTQVMHRCIGVAENGYIMCGDHQTEKEYGITDEQIIAVAKGFYRDEKYIPVENFWYKCYYRFWCASLKLRGIMLSVMNRLVSFEKIKNYDVQ